MDVETSPAGASWRQRRKLQTRHLLERYGVSDRSIDRWLANPDLNFPKPMVIGRRRYWDADEIDEFDRQRKAATA
jgi:predicted DNA-binding transcriptional regulator AlpA